MKTKLIKAINELYYRNYLDMKLPKMFPITSKTTSEKLYSLRNYIDDKFDKQFRYLITDLYWETREGVYTLHDSVVAKKHKAQVLALELNFLQSFKPTRITDTVVSTLSELSSESYFVGGVVRDNCRGIKAKDVDFVTDTPVLDLKPIFEAKGFKCDEVGLQFHVLVVSKDGESFEIANFRKDKNNTGGEIGDIFEDAQRRDFSIGAGYIRIHDTKLIDPNESFVDDIITETLKFVGKPKDRLDEDPIRALRFYRFMNRGFTADKKSLQAVRERMQNDSKRITQLQKVLTLPGVAEAVEKERVKTGDKVVTMTAQELSKDIIQLERMRLEIEKMVGV